MLEFKKGIKELLDVCAPWEVVSVTKREQAEGLSCGVVTIELAIRKGQLVPCPKCGRMCKRHDQKWRERRHRDLMEWRTLLRVAVPRANCPEHGVHQVEVPWAETHGRQTAALEMVVVDDLKLMSVQAAARTIWKHIEEILNASMLGISNALSESINSKVRWIKRQACGYRNRRNFRAAIHFHLEGLDLYPCSAFHTKP